ncbi:hypothetical protein KUTeg_004666 [Tegillarca granosa]|uniref:Uncharacterized protein n=1 Tax=Tegillarca granosa TaxID=220873 RepID=A0ABQ9FKE5_TEGGR|nr:hypothetical protein KUTeg_004666 [Tegillarca granosa]
MKSAALGFHEPHNLLSNKTLWLISVARLKKERINGKCRCLSKLMLAFKLKFNCSASSHIIEAFVVVFSIDDRQSFDVAVDLLYKLRKEENKDESIVLVANKCDLVRSRVISFEEAKSVARTYNCKIIETSSVLNHNVDDLLAGILSQIRLKSKDKTIKYGIN